VAPTVLYPSGVIFKNNDIVNGGSALFVIGKFFPFELVSGIIYMFYGIQIVTQNYINPAVDIVKKKGIMSSETLNVTLLAITNSAAESFIIVNSIFFGVSDIGIACVVQ
jgi:hypothetical protein